MGCEYHVAGMSLYCVEGAYSVQYSIYSYSFLF